LFFLTQTKTRMEQYFYGVCSLEAERIKALTKLKDEEREEALRLAWEEAERQKLEAIRLAEEALTKELNRKHALDKEKGIADALRIARVRFLFIILS